MPKPSYKVLHAEAVAALAESLWQLRHVGKNRRNRCGSCGIEIAQGRHRHAPGCAAAAVLAKARKLKRGGLAALELKATAAPKPKPAKAPRQPSTS